MDAKHVNNLNQVAASTGSSDEEEAAAAMATNDNNNNNNNTHSHHDSVRPTLFRRDNAKEPSPLERLYIEAYEAGGPLDPEGLVEVSLNDALDVARASIDSKDIATAADTTTTTTTPSTTTQLQKQPLQQFWIDVEVHGALDKATVDALHTAIIDHLPLGRSARFLRQHLRSTPTQWQTPQVVPSVNAAFIVTRVLGGVAPHMPAVRHTAALCLRQFVVTVTSNSVKRVDDKPMAPSPTTTPHTSLAQLALNYMYPSQQSRLQQDKKTRSLASLRPNDTIQNMLERELPEASVSGCVLLWLGFHIGRTATVAHEIRETLYDLAAVTSTSPDEGMEMVDYADIAASRDALLRCMAVAEEQSECVQAVAQGDAVTEGLTFDHSSLMTGAMNVVKQAAASTERLCLRLEKRLADLEHAYDAHQQTKINRRLNALTIMSAIFLPLTFMAGVYGMNFANMPELEYENSYYFLLAAMATVAGLLLSFFYYYGWLS